MASRLGCHIGLLLLALALAAVRVMQCVKSARERCLARYLWSVSLWLDAVEVILTVVVSGFFFRWIAVSASISVRELVEVTAAHRRDDLIAKTTRHREQLAEAAEVYRACLRLAGMAAIGMSLRVVLSLAKISYIGFFIDVFRRARPLLIAFAVFHTILLVGFAEAAHLLYGRTMLDYRGFRRSFLTLVNRQWGSGDSTNSIESALTERWASSVLFFWCFFIVFVLVSLSLLVAIVAHNYTEVSKVTVTVPLSQTLWKRAHDVRYRLRWEALRRSWVCTRARRLARRVRRWLTERWRAVQARGRSLSLAGVDRGGAFSRSWSVAHSVVLGAPSHGAGVSTASFVGGGEETAREEDANEEDLVDGADALAGHRLLRLLKEKLEEVGLGEAAEADAVNGGVARDEVNEGSGAPHGLSVSAELSNQWGWGRSASMQPGSSLTTLSSVSGSLNGPVPGGLLDSRRHAPALSAERHGGDRAWRSAEASAELSQMSGGLGSNGSHGAGTSSGNGGSRFSRWFAVDRRSPASGSGVHHQAGTRSSVLVEQLRAHEQMRVHRLTTVMVRNTDIAFLLAAVVEDATQGVARASETVDTFMDAYPRSFVNHLWEDLTWHYHYEHRSETRRARAAKDAQLRDRVESALVVLAPSFALVDSAQRQLEAQEGHLWPLVQALEQHGDTRRHVTGSHKSTGHSNAENDGDGGGANTVSGQGTRFMYSYSRQL